MTAEEIIELLDMQAHPEGGWYVETFRDRESVGGRARSTAIYFLLTQEQVSHWHRVDAVETWHWHAGAPLRLSISEDGQTIRSMMLGAALACGERPQGVVPAHAWQSAVTTGEWTLVGCTVVPGFEFSGFELAAEGWKPGA